MGRLIDNKMINMTGEQIKHLEFIQDVVTRMNSNSFQIKGWCITILSALCAIYATNQKPAFIGIALLPTLLFWCMDAYYLQQERKFRRLYKGVSEGDGTIDLFSMPIGKYTEGEFTYWASLWSKTILGLYGTLSVLILIALILLCRAELQSFFCYSK